MKNNSENFAFWLQGFVELQLDDSPPTKEQWKLIKEHLALVFDKVTPALNPREIRYCAGELNLNFTPEDYYAETKILNQTGISC